MSYLSYLILTNRELRCHTHTTYIVLTGLLIGGPGKGGLFPAFRSFFSTFPESKMAFFGFRPHLVLFRLSAKSIPGPLIPTKSKHGTFWHHKLPTNYSFLWNGHRTNVVSSTWQLACFCFEFGCKYFVSLVLCTFCEDTFGMYSFVLFHRSAEVLQKQKCLVGRPIQCYISGLSAYYTRMVFTS